MPMLIKSKVQNPNFKFTVFTFEISHLNFFLFELWTLSFGLLIALNFEL